MGFVMAANKRTKVQIECDRREIARLYLRGLTQAEIARRLSEDESRPYTLTQQQICYDLGVIREGWRKSALFDFNAAKGQELAQIDVLEFEYWQAWERSLQERKTVERKEVATTEGGEGKGGGARQEMSLYKQEMLGDPRFLSGVRWCIDRRIKLLGLDAPERAQNLNLDMSALSLEQLERIANGEDPWHVLATTGAGRDRAQEADAIDDGGDAPA